jgi:hypothetical protein
MEGAAVFYPWVVDEGAATRTLEQAPAAPLASDNALPSRDSTLDAIGLFNKRSRVRLPSVCRFADF